MNDPNNIFENERPAGTQLVTFELAEPFSGYITSSGEIVDNLGPFTPVVHPDSSAVIEGHFSTISRRPTELNKVVTAARTQSHQWAVISVPIEEAAAPPACSITLTDDIVALMGGYPLDISGHTVSKSVSLSSTYDDYYAGGPVVPLWVEGTRAFGYQASQFTKTDDVNLETVHALFLRSDDFSETVTLEFYGDYWLISHPGGYEFLTDQTDPFSKVALLVDSSGDVQAVIDGELYTKATIPEFAGLFTKPLLPFVWFDHRGLPTVYEATVYTAAADLASFGLPAGTLDWCGNVLPAPVQSCTITLTHDEIFAPMTVTGQTVSVTGDGTSNYGMWTGASGVPVNWTGVRVVEQGALAITGSTGDADFNLMRATDRTVVTVSWHTDTSGWFVHDYSNAIPLPGTISDRFAIGIDGATGDVIVYQNGSPVVTSSTLASFAGFFMGASAIISNVASGLDDGDTYSSEIITSADKYTESYPEGTKDWCGNPID